METDEPQPSEGRKLSYGKMLGSVAHAMNFHLGIVVGLLALFWRFGWLALRIGDVERVAPHSRAWRATD